LYRLCCSVIIKHPNVLTLAKELAPPWSYLALWATALRRRQSHRSSQRQGSLVTVVVNTGEHRHPLPLATLET
jgi:hypothetical protein